MSLVTFSLTLTTWDRSQTSYYIDDSEDFTFTLTSNSAYNCVITTFTVKTGSTNITNRCVINRLSKKVWKVLIPANTITGATTITAVSSTQSSELPVGKSYIRKGGDDKVDYNFDYDNITFSTRVVDGVTEYYYECSDFEDFTSKITNVNQPESLALNYRAGMHGKSNYGVKKSKIENGTLDWGFNSYGIINNDDRTKYLSGITFTGTDAITDANGEEWYKTILLNFTGARNWSSINCFGGYCSKEYTVDGNTYGISLGLDDSIFEQYPTTVTITNNLTNCSNDNSATSANTGDSYVAHVTASSGYHFEATDVVVMMGNTIVPVAYASDNKSFTISISNITDDIVITASATEWYTVSYNPITNATSDNPATRVREGDSYIANITANSGYFFDGHKSAGAYPCLINVQEYTSQQQSSLITYNDTHTVGVLSIANVDRNLTIRAVATNDGATIINNLTHCTSNNTTSPVSRDNYYYTATLTADDGYVFPQNKSTITVRVDNVTLFPSTHDNVVTISQDGKYAYIDTREYSSMATYNKSSIVITATAVSDSGLRVTNSLTDCTTNNPTTSLDYGDSYSATVTANSGYYFETTDVVVMMGNTAITPTFASDNKSFTVSISSATDDISVTASATAIPVVYHSITNVLTNCTNSNSATSIAENSTYLAVVTASDGYRFNRSDVNIAMGSTAIVPTFASDNKSFTISIANVTNDIVITASASTIPTHTITNTLEHCSNSNTATSILDGSTYTATVSASLDYYFEASNVSVMVGNTAVTPTFAGDNKSFTITITNVTDNIVIVASATEIQEEFSVTNNLTNCSNSNTSTIVVENSNYVATVTADNGYYFETSNVTVMMGSTIITPAFASDNKSFTINIVNVSDDIVITASSTLAPVTEYSVTNTLANCTTNNPSTSVAVNASYTATISAYTDYYFEASNVSVMMGSEVITPTFSSDNTTFTINITTVTNNIFIVATASSQAPVIVSDFGTCRVYNPTLSELADMMNHVTDNHYQNRTNDIIRLYKTYVSIPVKTDKEDIMLGDWNTTIESDVVSQQYITIECGNVTLSEVNENVIDYSPFTSLKVFLPYIGIKDVDIDVYRNKTINLKYKFDVISGRCIAILSVDGVVYDQFESDIADDIPYTGKQTVVYTTGDYTVGRYTVSSRVTTGEEFNALAMSKNYPYFIITQNVGHSPNSSIDGVANYSTSKIKDVTGLIRVNNVHLETKATSKEKREIELLLMQGIIVKENT